MYGVGNIMVFIYSKLKKPYFVTFYHLMPITFGIQVIVYCCHFSDAYDCLIYCSIWIIALLKNLFIEEAILQFGEKCYISM